MRDSTVYDGRRRVAAKRRTRDLVWLVALCLMAAAPAIAGERCEALRTFGLERGRIDSAESVPAGIFKVPDYPDYPGERIPVPAHCRVQGVLQPGPKSHARFEVWLPESDWNGRLEAVGNGGYAGLLSVWAVAEAIRHGAASVTTDTGHEANAIFPVDESWAREPDRLLDYGHRAIHEAAVAARALVAAYYGTPARHSYFASCSNGGRQALMEAQRYPADFDGILAGAPAAHFTRLNAWAAAMQQRFATQPEARLPAAIVPVLAQAAVAACDADDGLVDGLVDDPRRCRFDARKVACGAAPEGSCLTPPQLESLRLLRGGRGLATGQPFNGFLPGTESSAWLDWIIGRPEYAAGHHDFGERFFADFVFHDGKWRLPDLDVARDAPRARAELGPILDATDPDLRAFAARGGRLILYHGWGDAAIPGGDTIEYFDAVGRKMGRRARDAMSRLYLVSGLLHCSGGPGFTEFGAPDTAGSGDPGSDIYAALRAWVEEGRPPGAIVAIRKAGATAANDGSVPRPQTRPLCPYPQVARWNGQGDAADAASFSCGPPAQAGRRP